MKRITILYACLTVVACSPTPSAPPPSATAPAATSSPAAPAATPAAPAVKLYTMNCGSLEFGDVDMFADDGSMKGVARTLIDSCYLIRHPKGDLVWDTGVPEAIADMAGGLTPKDFPVHIVVPKKITAQLGELGLKPADIEYVSFSHKDFDHVGNGGLFASSTWTVDADERAAMFSDDARKSQDFASYQALEGARTDLIEGDATHDVFGDGTVVIHQAPGHTPGHTVLLVKTARSGAVLLTGDMWHLSESREKRLVPSFNFNREQTLASMDKVEAVAKDTGARIIRQHVSEDVASLPAFPMPLE